MSVLLQSYSAFLVSVLRRAWLSKHIIVAATASKAASLPSIESSDRGESGCVTV